MSTLITSIQWSGILKGILSLMDKTGLNRGMTRNCQEKTAINNWKIYRSKNLIDPFLVEVMSYLINLTIGLMARTVCFSKLLLSVEGSAGKNTKAVRKNISIRATQILHNQASKFWRPRHQNT